MPGKTIIARCLTLVLAAMLAHTSLASEGQSLEWFNDLSGDFSFQSFNNPSTELQKARYQGKAILGTEFSIVNLKAYSLFGDLHMATTTSDSTIRGLGISPMDITYATSMFGEYKSGGLLYRLGWSHACDHVIWKGEDAWYDEHDLPRDVFYHKVYLAAGTQTVRPIVQAKQIFDNEKRSLLERLVWYTEVACFIRSLGSIDKETLYCANNWQWQFTGELRYPLFAASKAAIFFNTRTVLLLDTSSRICWRESLQLEMFFRPGKFAASLFAGWYPIDEHPRDSLDGMTELGIRFVF